MKKVAASRAKWLPPTSVADIEVPWNLVLAPKDVPSPPQFQLPPGVTVDRGITAGMYHNILYNNCY